ncbi:MAG: hypothetical protein JW731_00745 [Bacteroidales bacterium]|nr:hypothetical protein [Bacteroidales bacterium]
MKKWILITTAILILGIIGAVLAYKFVYNKPHIDFEKATPDFILPAMEVYNSYKISRHEASEKYTGKVLQVTGTLSKIETPDSLTIAVFAIEEGMFGDEGIRCSMLEGQASKIQDLAGNEVTIKGFCTGFNDTDIIMEYCSLIE